jgi:hypothetical protein
MAVQQCPTCSNGPRRGHGLQPAAKIGCLTPSNPWSDDRAGVKSKAWCPQTRRPDPRQSRSPPSLRRLGSPRMQVRRLRCASCRSVYASPAHRGPVCAVSPGGNGHKCSESRQADVSLPVQGSMAPKGDGPSAEAQGDDALKDGDPPESPASPSKRSHGGSILRRGSSYSEHTMSPKGAGGRYDM